MERRAEKFVKRVIEQQGKPLLERPKKAARIAGEFMRKVKHSKGKQAGEIDERKHLKEHEDLEQLDLELKDPEGIEVYKAGDQIEDSIPIPKHIQLAVEVADREEPDPDLEFDPDHVSGGIEEVPLEIWQAKQLSKTREERELSAEPLPDQND